MIISGSMAIVTGASSGIGQSFTEHLLQKGATVYGLSRNLERMLAHKESLGNMGAHYHPFQMDISDHDAIESWVNEEFMVADI
ncbi:MAG: SDR family NAD(P)-dependent oxidoreductase, partial [Bacteroidota bacterium]